MITAGWSADQKFQVKTQDGSDYLWRESPLDKWENRREMFCWQQKLVQLDVPMCLPIEIGQEKNHVYTLWSWIAGVEAREVIPKYPKAVQYEYGIEAGKILKTVHSLPVPSDRLDWASYFNQKMDRKIKKYEACSLSFAGAPLFVDYMEANRHLLKGRPQVFQHGDYHLGNMMIEKDKLVIIDFYRFDFGDPWEEFNRIVWSAQVPPSFATGMLDGYFDNRIPSEFWRLSALYITSNQLSALSWSVAYDDAQIVIAINQAKDVLNWYQGMQKVVPSWYGH